jgi:hypothetical protein
MAMKKTEIIPIPIEVKPAPPYFEYKLVTHPKVENALDIFEALKGYRPKKMYHYKPPSGKFQSWIIKEE